MQENAAQQIHLADYRPFPFRIDHVDLTFRLHPATTRVISRLQITPLVPGQDLRLDGEGPRLIEARLDGHPVTIRPDATGITIPADLLPRTPFIWEAEVEIAPATNFALEGLYMSKGMYCTQCEAEGFRRITFYPDRPDVMAPFHVRIEGDMPVLLSNGNPTNSGPGWAEWHDPWPKPSYLFALVAGDLVAHPGRFTTMSGRDVALNVWVRPEDHDRCDWALQSLIRSMAWDEQVYGLQYDLDVFNIVAVDAFNMGAMENKGLNIFNSRAVLASPSTATDADFTRIEAIIAHEYFHNWTGNRITCRDWFQLSLKEGLTVYRDQQFSGDLRDHGVKRIEDVLALRERQFREDAGPLAHPVRPRSVVEINNFYTATIYEKGAEIIGMLRALVGEAGWQAGLDLYFGRHDGQACTIEDWLACFADATGRDLEQFARWYDQPGTPRLSVSDAWQDGTYSLTLTQTRPSGGDPLVIPVALGLLGPDGRDMIATRVLELDEDSRTFTFTGLNARPVPSVLRGFSAPVILDQPMDDATRAFLLAHDSDPFNRWEAGRSLAKQILVRMVGDERAAVPADWLEAMARMVTDDRLSPAYRALMLRLPGEDDMAQTLHANGIVPDPLAIHQARRRMSQALAVHLAPILPRLRREMATPGPYSADAESVGRRSLANAALGLISRLDGGTAAQEAYNTATNMTDQTAALACLIDAGKAEDALAAFEAEWAHDRLVMDKWFMLQVSHAAPDQAAAVAARLCERPDFDWKTPNRFRAVFGALPANHAGFHTQDGAAYRLLADWLIRLDPLNPQTAARMSTAFETWKRYDADRQAMIRDELVRIRTTPGLSRDLAEMTGRLLG